MFSIGKVAEKYDGLSIQLKATLWFTISGFLQRGISIISTPIFTRIMSTSEYGQFSVYTAWSGILIIPATLYLYNGVINNCFIKIEKNRDYTVAALQGLSTVSSLLFLFFVLVLQSILFPAIGLTKPVIIAMLISFIFEPCIYYWSISERFDYKYKMPVIVNMLSAILHVLVCVAAVVISDNKGEARILSYVFVTVCIGVFFWLRNIINGKCFFDKDIWLFALAFNIPLIPHFLSEVVLNQSDKIMINIFDSTSNAGIYSISYSIASLVLIFITALNASLVPWQYKSLKARDYDKMNKVSISVLLIVSGVLFLLMLFAPEAIMLLAGEKYRDSISLVPPLAVGMFFNFLQQLFVRVELYYEKKSYTVFASMASAVINVILNFIFIRIFGYQAVAYTTAFCFILVCVFHYVCYLKVCEQYAMIHRIYSPKALLGCSVIMCLIGGISLVLYKSVILRFSVACILVIACLLNRHSILNCVNKFIDK